MIVQPGVTIAIPNWNHEILLSRSIASALAGVEALAQAGVASEVLVVDDFSRDGSLVMLRQLEALYHHRGLRVLPFNANGGLAASRNQSLRNARFRYIAFMDADNELLPDTLPIFYRTMQDTEAAACYGNLLIRSEDEEYAHGVLSNESVQNRLYHANYIDAFALVDRVQVIDSGGYEASCVAHEDYELWLHLVSTGRKLVFVPVVFGYYYRLPGSMIQDEVEKYKPIHQRLRRVFDQVGVRKHLMTASHHLRYHPATGYLN